jgi:hypothetical protein
MATDKKGFILYADLIHTVNQLPSDKAGDLFKHILSYVNDKHPVTEDIVIKIAFEPIKQQLKRDLKKFEEVKIKRSDAGKLSAAKRKEQKEQSSTNPTSVKSVEQSSTNPTVSVNVNDNVNDILKRKQDFRLSIGSFIKANPNKYTKQLFIDFEEYWTEHGAKDKKMRFEKEKTFGLSRRLSSWSKNGYNDYTAKSNPSINNQPVN